MTDYIDLVLNEQYATDLMFYEYLEEQLVAEANFMFACLENNIILEAPTDVNKGAFGVWDKIVSFLKTLMAKFTGDVDKIIESNKEFVQNDVPKIASYDFKELKVKCIPYWVGANDTKGLVDDILNSLQKKPTNPDDIAKYSSREEVEKYDNFANVRIEGKSYAEAAKIKFAGGMKATDMPEAKIYENDEFKRIVTTNMIPFVTKFSERHNEIKGHTTKLINIVNKIKTELNNKKTVGESFSLLENAFFRDTDLQHCINGHILFEADENQQQDNKPSQNEKSEQKEKPESEMKVNKVQDTSDKPEKVGNLSKGLEGFEKHATQLAELVVAAEMSVNLNAYNSYISILKGIVGARGEKTKKEEKK